MARNLGQITALLVNLAELAALLGSFVVLGKQLLSQHLLHSVLQRAIRN